MYSTEAGALGFIFHIKPIVKIFSSLVEVVKKHFPAPTDNFAQTVLYQKTSNVSNSRNYEPKHEVLHKKPFCYPNLQNTSYKLTAKQNTWHQKVNC